MAKLWGDLGLELFETRVQALSQWLQQLDPGTDALDDVYIHRLATKLVWSRLHAWQHLDSVDPEDLAELGESVAERGFLRRAVATATQKGQIRNQGASAPSVGLPVDAVAIPQQPPAATGEWVSRRSTFQLSEVLTEARLTDADNHW